MTPERIRRMRWVLDIAVSLGADDVGYVQRGRFDQPWQRQRAMDLKLMERAGLVRSERREVRVNFSQRPEPLVHWFLTDAGRQFMADGRWFGVAP